MLLDRAERSILEISQGKATSGFSKLHAVLQDSFRQLEKLSERKDPITGLPTGFSDLDRQTAGLQPSDLIIIAGRPSMGKTTLALNIAAHAGMLTGKPIAIFSLEMSKEQMALRMLCAEARVDSAKLRTGFLSGDNWKSLTDAAGDLANRDNIYIDDTPMQTALDIRAKARRLRSEQGDLGLVIVDYLQLMQGRSRAENRQQEISDITRALKALARELNVPVVALSQLSRAVEQRKPAKPQLSDLRESGAIEQDADVVAMLYRDEVYEEDTDERGVAEVNIAKHRNGPTGTLRLAFRGNSPASTIWRARASTSVADGTRNLPVTASSQLTGAPPAIAEIDVGAFNHNIRTVQECLPPECEIMAVVKADAYGHGAQRWPRLLWQPAPPGSAWPGVWRALPFASTVSGRPSWCWGQPGPRKSSPSLTTASRLPSATVRTPPG